MRVLNTGSVAPHVHHQHAHQWLHTPNGAGNGLNYGDATFSPDEVRERIDAINANGGLYHFDPTSHFAANRQSRLRAQRASRWCYGRMLATGSGST